MHYDEGTNSPSVLLLQGVGTNRLHQDKHGIKQSFCSRFKRKRQNNLQIYKTYQSIPRAPFLNVTRAHSL